MKPYYEADGIAIYHGDAHEILPSIPEADLVLTDPPYNAVNRRSAGLRSLDKGTADSAPIQVEMLAREFTRIAASAYVWCSDEQYTAWTMAFKGLGSTTRICAWWKTNPSPMNGEHLWLSALELCVFARRHGAWFAARCGHPVWHGPSEDSYGGHPTPKPIWLMSRLLAASCPPTGCVLDPFMGEGTTLRAAKDLGRRAIGVELEERHCEMAALRLQQGVLDLGGVA